ncbi:hypothetical protein [Cupriavidus basilensis]|uniref:Uncharacterized protein n=1 Tax=Cupriavidus basilensis TaxID=68895 RepID=A0A0C4Y9A2_9BURK|nr:hypothetical protein [Cupriavidus basilensis]AJG18809.1 hypothetical protein RR42_m1407 [Cupriavidus basilensis]
MDQKTDDSPIYITGDVAKPILLAIEKVVAKAAKDGVSASVEEVGDTLADGLSNTDEAGRIEILRAISEMLIHNFEGFTLRPSEC